ncbi:MAG TPA: DNA-binding transcriptional regulator [Planctomicrobium sp.]|nr:DNA-binding transcriptional regulator [Planctomicrobium sp.]
MPELPSRPRVALLVETALIYGREILMGVADYVRIHNPWSIYVEQRDLTAEPPAWLLQQNWDGMIARTTSARFVDSVREAGIPLIDLNDRDKHFGVPRIRSDDHAIGVVAAEHLMERGFRQLAFCGFSGELWAQRRLQGFRQSVENRGVECAVYQSSWIGPKSLKWSTEQERLARWLRQLPRPLGIAACNDVRGQQVLECCRHLNLRIPDEVAVIGVDNDEVMCRLSDPPLSSIAPNARAVGGLAAEMLSQLMIGKATTVMETLVPPVGAIARLSTDTLAIDDPLISDAVRYIREHACQGIRVEDILRQIPISRSQLEQKFRKEIGRTPHAEIRKVQLQRVMQLLNETELPLKQIAKLTGFPHLEYLNYFFKRTVGQTPGDYRRTCGKRTDAIPVTE